MTAITHPDGCRCPGCLPSQYVMRPASPPRPRTPARTPQRQPARSGSSDYAKGWGYAILFVLAICTAIWPYWVWHGQNSAGGLRWDIHSTIACSIWWGLLFAAFLAYGVATGHLRPEWSAKTPAVKPQAPPLCTHGNRVEVLNGYFEKMGIRKLEAYWCPDCSTRLEADWKPSPAAVPAAAPAAAPVRAAAPGAGWGWRWWCTCGKSRTGWAATEFAAQAAIGIGVAAHQGARHRHEYRWWADRG